MQYNCRSLRCSWSIACRRCSNYIFILDLTSGFKGFGKESRRTVWESFKCFDLVCLILETWQYIILLMGIWCHPYLSPWFRAYPHNQAVTVSWIFKGHCLCGPMRLANAMGYINHWVPMKYAWAGLSATGMFRIPYHHCCYLYSVFPSIIPEAFAADIVCFALIIFCKIITIGHLKARPDDNFFANLMQQGIYDISLSLRYI